MPLKEQEPAPDFEVAADDGTQLRLSDLRGRRVVLFFYPRANTSGCIKEVCSFREEMPTFEEMDAVILGISPDPVEDVRAFREEYELPYRLLADPDHRVAEAYDVWREKNLYGRMHWGVERTTYVIGPDGRIERVFERVRPEGHADEVAAVL